MREDISLHPMIKKIFTEGRTHNAWLDRPVDDALLTDIHNLMKWGPTSANCCPLRIVFVKSKDGKEKLRPCLAPGNVYKTMAAPVIALLAQDIKFYEHLPKLFPHADARAWFEGNAPLSEETAIRNSSLQAAYFMMAARAVGLDCGPMSGFDKEKVNEAFFKDTSFKINMICNLGYGDAAKLYPRSPRFEFQDVCRFA